MAKRKEPPPGYRASRIPGFWEKIPPAPSASSALWPHLPTSLDKALDTPMREGKPLLWEGKESK